MDVVMLPLVRPYDAIESALQELRKRERGGVVVNNVADSYTLFHIGDLLRARALGAFKMQEVTGGHAVVLLDAPQAATHQLDLVRPLRTRQEYEDMFAKLGISYALAGESSDTGMIVTEHEGQTETLRSGGYECSGAPTHYYPEPVVMLGDPCPLYPECSDPAGDPPTIRPATY